jgi:hypothetical protein
LFAEGDIRVYTFNRGDGQRTITRNRFDNDTLIFGEGIKKSDIFTAFERERDLIVGIKDGEKKTLLNHDLLKIRDFSSRGRRLWGYIENFVFEDGTRLGLDGIMSLLGTDGNDSIDWGGVLNINTGDGNDYVHSYHGGNTIEGGKGDDTLIGEGTGGNTYIFNKGDGKDTIDSILATRETRSDRVLFGKDITRGDILTCMDGESLLIALKEDRKDFYELSDTIKAKSYKNLTLEFSDGTVQNLDEESEKQRCTIQFANDETVLFSAVHINRFPWYAPKYAIKLQEFHPVLVSGVMDTRMYSETIGVDIAHKIDNDTLYFYFPPLRELYQDFYGVDFHYTYLKTDYDPNWDRYQSEKECFKGLRACDSEDNCSFSGTRNTVGYSHCSIHPLVFEGKTVSGQNFKIEVLIGASQVPSGTGWRLPIFSCKKSAGMDCSAKLTLNMKPYNHITHNNPWRVTISPKPVNFEVQKDLTVDFYYSETITSGYGVFVEEYHLYLTDLFEYDNDTGELIMTDYGTEFLILSGKSALHGTLIGGYSAEDGKRYTFGHEFYVNVGSCTVKSKQVTEEAQEATANITAGDVIVLRCGENNYISTRALTNGAFYFDAVLPGCGPSVSLVKLDSSGDVSLPFDFECLNR